MRTQHGITQVMIDNLTAGFTIPPEPLLATEPEQAGSVVRLDKYTVRVDGIVIFSMTEDQERRVRELTPEQRAKFIEIMKGKQAAQIDTAAAAFTQFVAMNEPQAQARKAIREFNSHIQDGPVYGD